MSLPLPLSTDKTDLLLGVDNDLLLSNGDFSFALGLDGVTQLCRIAVQMMQGEWFLDLDLGIPYWDAILSASPDIAELAARSGFRDALLAVPGVTDILLLAIDFDDARSRTMTIRWQVRTALGDTPVEKLVSVGGS